MREGGKSLNRVPKTCDPIVHRLWYQCHPATEESASDRPRHCSADRRRRDQRLDFLASGGAAATNGRFNTELVVVGTGMFLVPPGGEGEPLTDCSVRVHR